MAVRQSQWTVTERSLTTGKPELVAIRPRHVCLLFRRFTSFNQDVTRPYVQALEARDIAHLLVGGKSFHDREEVETVRAALTSVEWPDDELSVFATLRGALFAIGDDCLLEYRHHFGRFHPYHVPAEPRGTPAASGRCPHAAPRAAPAAQYAAGCRHAERPADRDAGACRLRAPARRRAGPGQRAARRRSRQALRSRRRVVVSRIRQCPWRGGRPGRGARGADPRGRQRRRAHDDRPQGQGARVPGRGAGRSRRASCRATPPIAISTRRATSVPCAWPGGRRPICWTTSRSRSSAIVTKAIVSPTSPRRARATCWSCPSSATRRSPTGG